MLASLRISDRRGRLIGRPMLNGARWDWGTPSVVAIARPPFSVPGRGMWRIELNRHITPGQVGDAQALGT